MTGPPEKFSILIVCTANICRSPVAEHLLRAELDAYQSSTNFTVSSAGIRGWDGSEMEPNVAAELRRLGGDPREFRARAFTSQIGWAADLILTAGLEHRACVLQELPEALRRTFTLLEFAHLVSEVPSVRDAGGSPREVVRRAAAARGAASIEEYDIADPFGGTLEGHRETATSIHRAVAAIAAGLVGQRVTR